LPTHPLKSSSSKLISHCLAQELQKQDKRNHEAYIRSGEVFEDREKSYEKAVKAWERGWASVTQLVPILSIPLTGEIADLD